MAQRPQHIGHQVIAIFDADRQPDQSRRNAKDCALFIAQALMISTAHLRSRVEMPLLAVLGGELFTTIATPF